MKYVVAATCAALIATAAYAQAPVATCKAQSATKKLAGAETSFMTKCQTDAKVACEASAKEKKLAGAAATSHVEKCVRDTVGS